MDFYLPNRGVGRRELDLAFKAQLGSVMPKSFVKARKSYQDGHVAVHVSGGAHQRGTSLTGTITVDMTLSAAMALQQELAAAIAKEEAKMTANADREARRKAWRDREVAAGRMKIISFRA